MLNRNDLLVAWIKRKAETAYRDDIALVLLYGSYVNKTSNPLSDLDCFFIPATERGYGFGRTFILEGIGIDLFPMSWERVEGLADFREAIVPLLGNAEILYARSDADRERYLGLRTLLHERLNDARYMRDKAVATFRASLVHRDRLATAATLSEARLHAGLGMLRLADAVAYVNQTYFTRGLKKQIEDLRGYFEKPERFLQTYDEIVRADTPEAVRQAGRRLFDYTAKFLGLESGPSAPPAPVADASGPADGPADWAEWYQEASSSFNKIYHSVGTGNAAPAFIAAVNLQAVLRADCPHLPAYDFLAAFDARDLGKLAARAKAIEADLVDRIAAGGARLEAYATIDEFLARN